MEAERSGRSRGRKVIPRDPETKARAAKRQDVALESLAGGMPSVEIVKKLINEYGARWRTAYQDIAMARKRLSAGTAKRGTDEAIGEAIAKAEAHYVRCVKSGDNHAGLATLKHLAQLTGAMQLVDGHVQAQIAQLRVQFEGGSAKGDGQVRGELTVTAFNAARSVYGIPALTPEQFAEYKRSHQRRQVIVVPDGGNGANGSGGNGTG